MQTEFDIRVKYIANGLWTSLREYTHRKPSREEIIDAKTSIKEITTAALCFYIDIMKYTTDLSFTAGNCSVGAKFQSGPMEEVLGVSLQGHVRLVVSPPLYIDLSDDKTTRAKRVLRRVQVSQSIFERQPRCIQPSRTARMWI